MSVFLKVIVRAKQIDATNEGGSDEPRGARWKGMAIVTEITFSSSRQVLDFEKQVNPEI
jgi:hypothetical protein